MQWRAHWIEFRFLVLNVPLTYISGLKLFPDLYFLFLGYTSGGHDRSIHLATIPARRSLHAYLYPQPHPPVQILICTKYQIPTPFSSYYTVLAIQNYVSFSLITSLNLVFVFVTTVLLLPPRTFNFENILWTVLFSGKQPAQKWTSSNLNQILTKGSFNKSRASPLI